MRLAAALTRFVAMDSVGSDLVGWLKGAAFFGAGVLVLGLATILTFTPEHSVHSPLLFFFFACLQVIYTLAQHYSCGHLYTGP
jgi:hypothetical protein